MTYGKPWTDEQVKFLTEHYLKSERAMLVQVLQRKPLAIKQKAYRLGILPQKIVTPPRQILGTDPLIDRLRKERHRLKWSLAYLASKTGYAKSSLSHWEYGHAQPRIKVVRDWAQALGLEIGVVEISTIMVPLKRKMVGVRA